MPEDISYYRVKPADAPDIRQAAAKLVREHIALSAGDTGVSKGALTKISDTVYELAKKVSDVEFKTINIDKILPFEAWNYKISPAIIG